MTLTAAHLEGWVPIRLYWEDQTPLIDWCWVGERPFAEPSFVQTINRCLELPFSSLFRPQTSIEVLAECYSAEPGPTPSGFIFHLSRSGSTLVSQMLADLPDNIVINEAGPIDAVLRARFLPQAISDDLRAQWLRWTVSALSRPRMQSGKRLFVRFHSWGVFDLPVIHTAFPNVPWIFVYRDPIALLGSQLNHRDAHMIPGALEPELFAFTADEAFEMQPEEYCARVLARIADAALLHHKSSGGLLINHNQLRDSLWNKVSDHFGISPPESNRKSMQIAINIDTRNHVRRLGTGFQRHHPPLSAAVRGAVERWLAPVYGELEAVRLANGKDS